MLERLRQFIDSLKWSVWRKNNANHTRRRIERIEGLENDYDRYFPLYHLDLAAHLFSMGEDFDYASVFHSSSALALGLLIKLNSILSDQGREKIGSLTLKPLIEKSRENGLLDEEHYNVAEDIRNIRNCYVHFENMMAYINRLFKYYQNKEDIVATYDTKEEREIVKTILNSFSTKHIAIPDMTWCANKDAIMKLEERHGIFGRTLIRILDESHEDIDKALREYKRLEGLFLTTADTSCCLNNSLKFLNI